MLSVWYTGNGYLCDTEITKGWYLLTYIVYNNRECFISAVRLSLEFAHALLKDSVKQYDNQKFNTLSQNERKHNCVHVNYVQLDDLSDVY